MSDYPVTLADAPMRGVIFPYGLDQPMGMLARDFTGTPAAAAWPAANRAIYVPFMVHDKEVLATQLLWTVGAQAGNYDAGIYTERGVRLTSIGSTVVPAAGNARADFANVTLPVGFYYAGMVMSTVTTLTVSRYTTNNIVARLAGVQQEALGSTVLPATATFANPANSYVPLLGVLIDKTP